MKVIKNKPVRLCLSLSLLMGVFCVDSAQAQLKGLPEAPQFKMDRVIRGTDGKFKVDTKKSTIPKEFSDRKKYLSHGSGFAINHSGGVMTNYHVIKDCGNVSLEFEPGTYVSAQVLHVNPKHDLAILQTQSKVPAIGHFRWPEGLEKGDPLIVAGFPTRTLAPVKIVVKPETFISKDMKEDTFSMQGEVYPGNSGGPVLDESGAVMGVVFAKINSVSVYKKTGKVLRDIGYAVTNKRAIEFMKRFNIKYSLASETKLRTKANAKGAVSPYPFVAKIGCWRK